MAGSKTAIWVVGGIAGLTLLCCGGVGVGLFSFYKGSMAEADKHKPFVSQLMVKMSDSGYDFAAVSSQFDTDVYKGSELEAFGSYLRLYKEKLGKFKSLGKSIGFFTESNNGVSIQKYTYEATFEKATGSVSVVFKNGNTSKVAGFAIVSPALD